MLPVANETADPTYAAIRAAVSASYSGALGSTRLPPLEVLAYLATAIGSLYREVAGAHEGPDGCPCGWEPCALMDVITMQQALASSAFPNDDPRHTALLTIEPAGHS